MSSPTPKAPHRDIRVARKDYPCGAPHRPCKRRIRPGDPYTQISYPPEPPRYHWTIVRACSACEPLPSALVPSERIPCPIGRGDLQCDLPAGHPPPCQYPIGLF